MENDLKFEEMSSQEQINKLKSIMSQIQALEMATNREQIINGNFEIRDVSFTRLPNGEVAYDAIINQPDGSVTHAYYSETNNSLAKIDVAEKQNEIDNISTALVQYQSAGMDLTELNNSLMEKNELMEALQSPEKISLNQLVIVRQELMDFAISCGIQPAEIEAILKIPGNMSLQITPEELRKIEETALDLGANPNITLEDVEFDEKGISLDDSLINHSNSGEIKGSERVTTNYTFNQIIGLQYDSYRIIKTSSDEPIVIGITQDGRAAKIPDGILEANSQDTKSMSLIRDDGTIVEASVVASFRLKDAGSTVGRDQAIGICMDNGESRCFYARNAGGENLIGEELPSRVYTSQRINNENLLDPTLNRNTDAEARSAYNRVKNYNTTNINKIGDGQSNKMMEQEDTDELIKKYAEKYEVDEDELRENYELALKKSSSQDLTDEQIIESQADAMSNEPQQDHDERTPFAGSRRFPY